MFEYVPARQDVLSPTTCRVYKNSLEYAGYLNSRFKAQETTTFAFNGDFWVFSHAGEDEDGMFDVLRLAKHSLATVKAQTIQDSGHEQFMRDRTDIPGFFNITVPMSVLRALLPPVMKSGHSMTPRARRA